MVASITSYDAITQDWALDATGNWSDLDVDDDGRRKGASHQIWPGWAIEGKKRLPSGTGRRCC
jgi:hypothetical protein